VKTEPQTRYAKSISDSEIIASNASFQISAAAEATSFKENWSPEQIRAMQVQRDEIAHFNSGDSHLPKTGGGAYPAKR